MTQELIVFAIVAAAALFLGRNALNALRGKKTCGTCPAANGGCGTTDPNQANGGLPFQV